MKRRQILKFIPFFAFLGTSVANARNRPNDVAQLFDMAAAKHKQELRALPA